ncbi:branched-chain amino acid ABC transporter permease [Ciceribacter sp. L1K22]|uniref:branched-chain amino acid ABC transporter permease n=1 Tax=Ciceribacter sp. L1K22 TaxID=2820275 RepID=UPI001ABDB9BD|nr:branched-chain amino acid ABC transporter permease [Ciceribacter sp. L1K22]MBO3759715.1 branched-chain amino acid ABC transporter permease [Ciceribacter sp. L1K22]
MAYFLQQLVNAIPIAALYAALAFGYSVAFGMTRRADIVFGGLFAFAGQIYLLFTAMGWNAFILVLPAALVMGGLVSLGYTLAAGYWVGKSVMLPLHRRSPNAVIAASLAVLVVISETGRLALDSRGLWLPRFLDQRLIFWRSAGFDVSLTLIQLVNATLMATIVASGHAILSRTSAGRIWRGVSDDPAAAALCGVDAGRVFILSYLAATAIAAICGILATSYYGTMDFGAGLMFGLKVVLIAAAGGYGVPLRSALGAAAIGVAETMWSGYAPIVWRDLIVVGALVMVLVISRRERVVP